MWEYLWEVGEPGTYSLLSRATSASGRTQPAAHDPLNGGYLVHHPRPVEVRVEGARLPEPVRGDWDALVYDMNAFAEDNSRMRLDVELEFSAGEGI
jgi:hypothetical protein